MGVCPRVSPFLFALVLQAAAMGSSERTPHQDLTYHVGGTATFSLEVPQKFNLTNLLWRSSSRGSAVAFAAWEPGDALEILSGLYHERVTFHEQSRALEIHNLRIADGGAYEVVQLQDPLETRLKEYTLVVFDINITASKLANGSCSVSLLCQVGVGAKTKVDYSWIPGGPGDRGSALHLLLHPEDMDKAYTCTATALGARHTFSVTPYPFCSAGTRAAGLLGPVLLALLLLLLPLL